MRLLQPCHLNTPRLPENSTALSVPSLATSVPGYPARNFFNIRA